MTQGPELSSEVRGNYVTKRDRIKAIQRASNLSLPPFSDIVGTALLRWTRTCNIVRMSSERLPRQMMFAWMGAPPARQAR